MSESNAMPIPEDLKWLYRSEAFSVEEYSLDGAQCVHVDDLIERIGRAEQRVQELEAALTQISDCNGGEDISGWGSPEDVWRIATDALSKGAQPKEEA